jgi:hypothetical protein
MTGMDTPRALLALSLRTAAATTVACSRTSGSTGPTSTAGSWARVTPASTTRRSPGDETLALGSGERVVLIRSVVDQFRISSNRSAKYR